MIKKGEQAACRWQEQNYTCMRTASIVHFLVLLSLVILALGTSEVFSQVYAVTAHTMRSVEVSRLTEHDRVMTPQYAVNRRITCRA